VKLSPTVSYFLRAIASPFRVTLNEHAACRAIASLAVQFTVVVPSRKPAPDAGEQVVMTGAAPSLTVGAAYVTACDGLDTPVTVTSAGHAICGGFGVLGPVGGAGGVFEPQLALRITAAGATN
jgi:hypothetical protein